MKMPELPELDTPYRDRERAYDAALRVSRLLDGAGVSVDRYRDEDGQPVWFLRVDSPREAQRIGA